MLREFLADNAEALEEESNVCSLFVEQTLFSNCEDLTEAGVESGRDKGRERFKKLSLAERYILFKYFDEADSAKEWRQKYDALNQKYNEFAEKTASLNSDYEKLQKENKKLKKQNLQLQKDASATATVETKSPTKRRKKSESDEVPPEKLAKLAEKKEQDRLQQLIKAAPPRPPGTVKAFFAAQLRQNGEKVTPDVVNSKFAGLTDDQKRAHKVELKQANNAYFPKMKEYLNGLSTEDRCFVETKLKLKAGWAKQQDLSLDDLFPERPRPPATLYFFFATVKNEEITGETEKLLAENSSLGKLVARSKAQKKLYEALTKKELKKLTKEHKKSEVAYQENLRVFKEGLTEERKCTFDMLMMKKSAKHKPEWLLKEPKTTANVFTYFSEKMRAANKDEWEGLPLPDVSRRIGTAWKDLSKEKKDKTKKAFEKAKSKLDNEHKAWFESLSEAQQKMYNDLNEAKRAKGDDPLVESVRLADKMYNEMKDLDSAARKRYFEDQEADFESVKAMYVNSVGIKKKKPKTREDKWSKMIDQDDFKDVLDYLSTLSKRAEKKKEIVFSDGTKPEKISPKKSEPAAKRPPIGSKKWRVLVDEMAPGHPVPPQSVYNLFRKMAKAEGLNKMEPAAIKAMYADKTNETVSRAQKKFDELNEQYKEDVHVWLESLDEDVREKYESMFMRSAKTTDRHNRTANLETEAAADMSYLDLQPKTPAYRMCAESDEEDNRIEEM